MKSKKERHEFLKQILYDAGLSKSSMLTIAACKRLKGVRERAKEISELDVGNIITNDGGKRSSRRTTAATSSAGVDKSAKKKYHKSLEEDDDYDDNSDESSGSESEVAIKADDFSRIKDLIESDESETDKKKSKKQVSKKTVSDSE